LWVIAVLLAVVPNAFSKQMRRSTDLDSYVSVNGSDSNAGSASKPWATIQYAGIHAKPGMTIHVGPGHYTGPIHTRISGSSKEKIRFLSDQRWGARIEASESEIAWNNEGDYVEIMGFDIKGGKRLGIVNYGSSVRIVGNRVSDVPVEGCTSDGGAGIDQANYDADRDDTIGNVVYGIGKSGCPRAHGIYHASPRGHIWNNVVHDNQGYGIQLWHAAQQVEVANNLVYRNAAGGILVGAGDAPGGVIDDGTTVSNNVVLQNRIGIREEGLTGKNNFYFNNLLYGNQEDFMLQDGKQEGTLHLDPLVIQNKLGNVEEFEFLGRSPVIDSGTSVSAPNNDIHGVPRPQLLGWDIGPYEQGTPKKATWPWD
jgi:hypothetical protein